MYSDHMMMELERRLCDINHRDRSIATLAEDIGLRDMPIPDDGLVIAADLEPIDPEGPVHRGVIQFPIVVSGLDQTHRRLARIIYAINLRTHVDEDTGEQVREMNTAVSVCHVLLLDEGEYRYVWEKLDDRLLPLATMRELEARMVDAAIEVEQQTTEIAPKT